MEELKLLIPEEEIKKRVKELAQEIDRNHRGQSVVFVGILKGAFIFLADLVRQIKGVDLAIDFVRLASYGTSDTSSGQIQITKDIELSLKDKEVIIVEDIVDTGLTLKYLQDYLKSHQPNSVKVCCLINKTERREIEINIDYCGFTIPKGFLVGYGLDYAEKYRHLPEIYEIVRK